MRIGKRIFSMPKPIARRSGVIVWKAIFVMTLGLTILQGRLIIW
jgi:hypothetical protein